MASIVHEYLRNKILPHLDAGSMTLPPALQEAYLAPNGWLDKGIVSKLAGVTVSNNTFRKTVKDVFGAVEFQRVIFEETLTSEEFFRDVYTFGGASHSSEWVLIAFEKTGKVAKRETILHWIFNNVCG